MRYSVAFQNTTEEWVLFDTVDCYLLPGRYRSEEEAFLAASRLAETDRQISTGSTYRAA